MKTKQPYTFNQPHLMGLAIIMVLGLSIILSQTLKAANANPVNILRLE